MKKILVSFIQDRSGSMASVWEETLNGFKSYVEDLQKDQQKDNEVEYIFSLTTFDTLIDTPYLGESIAKIEGTKLKNFAPRGMTALYDAVGKTLQAVDDHKEINFDKAIVLIVTDGCENASREWSKDALHAAIDERIKRGNWTFTYLGTQPETWENASSLGMGVGASAVYDAQNAGDTYKMMAYASAQGARSAPGQFRSFISDNTTKVQRGNVGMRTQNDPQSPSGAIPPVTGKGVPVSTFTGIPKPPTFKQPIPPAKPDGRWR